MSETAQTLINAALRSIGTYASGESPSAQELADGLEALRFMLQSWSARNIRLYYTKQDTKVLTGAASYTIGAGGSIDTVRPASIRGAYVRDGAGSDHTLDIIDEARYRSISLKSIGEIPEYLYYNPEYPLGVLYLYPLGTGTLYLDSLKPLTDPTLVTDTISFPPEYNEAIKYNLAVRLSSEYGVEVSNDIVSLGNIALSYIESRNFASQINTVRPTIIKLIQRFNIDQG